MSQTAKSYIIGIGADGLEGVAPSARKLIEAADLVVGDQRTLGLIPESTSQRLVVGANPDEAIAKIDQSTARSIAILASGDPLFYGLARYLCDKLGKDRFDVIPHVSSMQLAFARVRESWDEAYLTNLANHPVESVVEKIRIAEKVGLFTTDTCGPAQVAQALIDRQINYFSAYVCENLGSPDERVTFGALSEIARQDFSPLNVMVLVRTPGAPDQPRETTRFRLFGNPDEAFLQAKPKRGLLTPAEVRAMALAELDVSPGSVVWDVGAGSGSVSIEAARLAANGTVYAIEMDTEDHQLIVENSRRFAVPNVVPVLGRAPEAWADLPDPDCVFVEGSGREISRMVQQAFDRLRPDGRLVANVGSIESLADIHRAMIQNSSQVNVWMVNLARGTYQLERLRFEAINPTFLLSVTKQPD